MKLGAKETDLTGKWIVAAGKVVADETCQRIKSLVSQHLEKVAGGGWDTLYKDPEDGRYWELTYPESHLHGGGPPRLSNLSYEQASMKYSIDKV